MGGGTTLVESILLNRNSIGFDISSFATFISKVKTTLLSTIEIDIIKKWSLEIRDKLNCHTSSKRPSIWIEKGYQRNLSSKETPVFRNAEP